MREELEIMQGKKKDHRVGLVVDGYCVTRGRRGSSWNAHAVYGSSMASSPEIRRPRYRTIDGSPSTDRWFASLSTTKSSGSLRSIGTKTSPNNLPFSLSSWKEKPAPSMSPPDSKSQTTEDGPDQYCALRLRTSPEGNTRHQEHAAHGRADFLQVASLVTWLTQKVSLIQGPPGEFIHSYFDISCC